MLSIIYLLVILSIIMSTYKTFEIVDNHKKTLRALLFLVSLIGVISSVLIVIGIVVNPVGNYLIPELVNFYDVLILFVMLAFLKVWRGLFFLLPAILWISYWILLVAYIWIFKPPLFGMFG